MKRTCAKTGLGLLSGPVSGVRIANPAYGPLAPPERVEKSRTGWSRWDTMSRTLYIAEDEETAFRECLAWARMTGEHQAHVDKLSALFGETIDQTMRDIDEDWKRLGHMQPGHLPASWRDGHLLYRIQVPETAGWWIDAHAPETLDALSLAAGSDLARFTGQQDIDKGVMFTHDREVTTRLAERMREQILDDGTEPLGIRFDSRIAKGTCWALWMRRADAKLGSDPVKANHGAAIGPTDPVMKWVMTAYGIHSW